MYARRVKRLPRLTEAQGITDDEATPQSVVEGDRSDVSSSPSLPPRGATPF